MKIVSLELKKVSIGKFFPKENNVELHIKFNDGQDKEIMKNADINDAEGSAENIITRHFNCQATCNAWWKTKGKNKERQEKQTFWKKKKC